MSAAEEADMSVCRVTQQTCLLCDTQTCLLCHTTDVSVVSGGRHVCCVIQQTCLLRHTADTSAVSHSRHGCCVTRQTCLPCHGKVEKKVTTFLQRPLNSQGKYICNNMPNHSMCPFTATVSISAKRPNEGLFKSNLK